MMYVYVISANGSPCGKVQKTIVLKHVAGMECQFHKYKFTSYLSPSNRFMTVKYCGRNRWWHQNPKETFSIVLYFHVLYDYLAVSGSKAADLFFDRHSDHTYLMCG